MKAYKLDLQTWDLEIGGAPNWQAIALALAPEGIPEELVKANTPGKASYPFRENLVDIMFSPRLKNNSVDTLKTNTIADKILDEANESLLLTEDENRLVRNAEKTHDGYRRIDVPFIERMRNMPEVEVEEKKDDDSS